ncbi:MAG TPA: TPM domain-containing protein, partial [Gemmatimonadaceae bacterium]|nr:TPM domain-containing protein [Gemmatimonadaceae bacterium]
MIQAILALLLLQATPLPQPRGFVNDFADLISASDEARIQAIVQDVRAKSGGEIVVVTLPDLGDVPASDMALRIGREWRVGALGQPGDARRNSGVIILLVPNQTNSSGRGECRIEVGYGAEG